MDIYIPSIIVVTFFVLIFIFRAKPQKIQNNQIKTEIVKPEMVETEMLKKDIVNLNRTFMHFVLNQLNDDVDKEFAYFVKHYHCSLEEIVPLALNKSKKELLKNAEFLSKRYLIPVSRVKVVIEDCSKEISNLRK